MRLYLVRHGDCVPADQDPEQPLSERGRKETEKVGRLLQDLTPDIGEIRHSVKKRAKQTAEIIAKTIGYKGRLGEREGLKPMDPIEPIFDEIRISDQNLMFVGHLPFMERLLSHLLYGEERECPVNFCGSCLVCLEGEGPKWKIVGVLSP